jgi:hypothetical protein
MVMRIIFAIGKVSSRISVFNVDNDRFGGESVSLAVNYTKKEQFAAAGYTPFVVDGTEYGEVRRHGNFSFLRVYEGS